VANPPPYMLMMTAHAATNRATFRIWPVAGMSAYSTAPSAKKMA
jgi:hypothetical protein